jgi:hypothetical protein
MGGDSRVFHESLQYTKQDPVPKFFSNLMHPENRVRGGPKMQKCTRHRHSMLSFLSRQDNYHLRYKFNFNKFTSLFAISGYLMKFIIFFHSALSACLRNFYPGTQSLPVFFFLTSVAAANKAGIRGTKVLVASVGPWQANMLLILVSSLLHAGIVLI